MRTNKEPMEQTAQRGARPGGAAAAGGAPFPPPSFFHSASTPLLAEHNTVVQTAAQRRYLAVPPFLPKAADYSTPLHPSRAHSTPASSPRL